MPNYHELCQRFTVWQDRLIKHENDALAVAQRIMRGFSDFIDAPETFQNPYDSKQLRYLRLVQTQINEEGDATFVEAASRRDLLQRDLDGWWMIGIEIYLEQGERVWPKMPFCFFLRYGLFDRMWQVHFRPNNSVRFDIPDEGAHDMDPIYQFMFSEFDVVFSSGVGPRNTKQTTIGFHPTKQL